jgi:hypothetical protein
MKPKAAAEAADGPDLLSGSKPAPDEMRQLLGKTGDDKGFGTAEHEIEQSIASAGNRRDEKFSDQTTSRAHELQELIESITPETPKGQILQLLSDSLPPLMAWENETMTEAILEDLKECFGLVGSHLKALRKDIDKARRNLRPRSSECNAASPCSAKAELDEWLPIAESLISSNNILEQVVEVLKGFGLVGHEREAKLIYLALTSRLSDAPVNIVIKGASSAGKNHIVREVLRLFPKSAYSDLSSMSDKALIYWDEPLSHMHLVLYEAAGLNSEFVAYLIRTLLSEGKVRYRVGKKLIEKAGPTGFITTTTAANLHPENETRMLTLQADESPEQTQRVMISQARGTNYCEGDLVRFRALQRVIEIEKPEVIIPYGEKLARAISPVAIRLRRDFPTVLNLIKAHAVLQARNRERDSQGRLLATLADYEAVYDLVDDLLNAMVMRGDLSVDEKIKETVAVVTELCGNGQNQEEVNVRRIATRLKVNEKTTWRWVQSAIAAGYLINKETRKRAEARIILGVPITDHVLPPPQLLSTTA